MTFITGDHDPDLDAGPSLPEQGPCRDCRTEPRPESVADCQAGCLNDHAAAPPPPSPELAASPGRWADEEPCPAGLISARPAPGGRDLISIMRDLGGGPAGPGLLRQVADGYDPLGLNPWGARLRGAADEITAQLTIFDGPELDPGWSPCPGCEAEPPPASSEQCMVTACSASQGTDTDRLLGLAELDERAEPVTRENDDESAVRSVVREAIAYVTVLRDVAAKLNQARVTEVRARRARWEVEAEQKARLAAREKWALELKDDPELGIENPLAGKNPEVRQLKRAAWEASDPVVQECQALMRTAVLAHEDAQARVQELHEAQRAFERGAELMASVMRYLT